MSDISGLPEDRVKEVAGMVPFSRMASWTAHDSLPQRMSVTERSPDQGSPKVRSQVGRSC